MFIRLGVFHTSSEYWSAIWKSMEGSGAEQIAFPSDLCASGSINKVLNGKHHCRYVLKTLLIDHRLPTWVERFAVVPADKAVVATTESTALAGPQSNITEAHVKRVLKADKGSNAQLNSWSVKDFTQKGDNYANVVTSVSVSYSIHGKDQSVSYVVKINTKHNVDNEMDFFIAILFKKEAEFYEEIMPLLNSELTSVGLRELRMPTWFHTHCEDGQDMIFLENLRPQGYQMFDRRKVMDVPHATLVLQELARMHAASRLLQARTPDEEFCDQFKYIKTTWTNFCDTAKEMVNNFFASTICNAEEMLHKVKGYELAEQWMAKNKTDTAGVIERHLIRDPKFDVICHGDCWNNNVLFRFLKVVC
ncbi:putative Ecdysteroid kinase-containing protein 4 [Homarus americanus]|uniref:Putative Ecdysteroid kinase-containing protein 4 n=1 Tax=Homarus americanus TaxID=6706 RepID=A0A8J5NDM1_HOMAM|nr:putative Ecdysteroid kinase-containing protein 4 [Homarus americanus]